MLKEAADSEKLESPKVRKSQREKKVTNYAEDSPRTLAKDLKNKNGKKGRANQFVPETTDEDGEEDEVEKPKRKLLGITSLLDEGRDKSSQLRKNESENGELFQSEEDDLDLGQLDNDRHKDIKPKRTTPAKRRHRKSTVPLEAPSSEEKFKDEDNKNEATKNSSNLESGDSNCSLTSRDEKKSKPPKKSKKSTRFNDYILEDGGGVADSESSQKCSQGEQKTRSSKSRGQKNKGYSKFQDSENEDNSESSQILKSDKELAIQIKTTKKAKSCSKFMDEDEGDSETGNVGTKNGSGEKSNKFKRKTKQSKIFDSFAKQLDEGVKQIKAEDKQKKKKSCSKFLDETSFGSKTSGDEFGKMNLLLKSPSTKVKKLSLIFTL